ncbi:MAG: hypothetical protein H8D94_01835 [Candidatus Pelagibacter sp.]|nr:hypothetical protein [Candidatus Pelagibacter sp.]
MEYKIKDGMREQLINTLVEVEWDQLTDSMIKEILLDGCEGWNNMTDDQLIEWCEDKETYLERRMNKKESK